MANTHEGKSSHAIPAEGGGRTHQKYGQMKEVKFTQP
jgi:hypothetical protein